MSQTYSDKRKLVKDIISQVNVTPKLKPIIDAMTLWVDSREHSDFQFQLAEDPKERANQVRNHAWLIRKEMTRICKKDDFPYLPCLEKKQGSDHLVLSYRPVPLREIASLQDTETSTSKPTEVVILTSYHECTFVDQLMLGSQSIADKLQIPLRILRFDNDDDLSSSLLIEVDRKKEVRNNAVATKFIIDWRDPNKVIAWKNWLKENQIDAVETVNLGAAVSQDNQEIGRLAAEFMTEIGVPSEGKVGVIFPSSHGDHNPTRVRRDSFSSYLKMSDNNKKVQLVDIDIPDVRNYSSSTRMIPSIVDTLREHPDLDAIYATSGDATLAAVMTLHATNKKIPVVGTDILSELLPLLSEPDSVLYGLVGGDPYSYGRLKMRVCLGIEQASKEQFVPVKLSKRQYLHLANPIRSMYEFSRRYEDHYIYRHEPKGKFLEQREQPAQAAKSIFVGIGGGSGTGKSTIANIVKAKRPYLEVQTISLDNFYKRGLGRGTNFDHPDVFSWDEIVGVLDSLRAGISTMSPTYSFHAGRRSSLVYTSHAPVVIVEGLYALHSAIKGHLDLRFHLDANDDVLWDRRISRDKQTRGKSDEPAERKRFEVQVLPALNEHIRPLNRQANAVEYDTVQFTAEQIADEIISRIHQVKSSSPK